VIADRTRENLRSSDLGITMMRQQFLADLEAVAAGKDPKGVIRDPNAAKCIALPNMMREINTDGISLKEFDNHPLLKQRLREFRHHFGQPPEVRRAFEEAMGIAAK
jgi:5,5'-dehydrodivanillate O-demethylase